MAETLTPAQREEYEERAAILQFDAGVDQQEAERLAMKWTLEKIEAEKKNK